MTFAHKVGGEVATFGVSDAPGGQGGVLALVDVGASVTIARVAFATRTKVTAKGIGAIGKDIAWPVFAFVVVGHITPFTPIAIVTVALTVQTGAVFTFTACRITTII